MIINNFMVVNDFMLVINSTFVEHNKISKNKQKVLVFERQIYHTNQKWALAQQKKRLEKSRRFQSYTEVSSCLGNPSLIGH